MNTAITTALNNALAAYSTTAQMNAAIAAALTPYYTKTEIDTLLESKADIDGNYPQLVAGNVVGEFNQEAEVSFRPSAGTVDIQSGYKVNYGGHLEGVKGNTVSWNQLYDSAVPTAATGHKYYCRENNSGTIRTAIVLAADLATWFTAGSTERNVCDLSIIYSINNEPSVVADFEADYLRWFGKPLSYEAYNVGELIPVKMAGLKTVGFNAWDEQWEIGTIDVVTGFNVDNPTSIRSSHYIQTIPNAVYFISYLIAKIRLYDVNKKYLGYPSITNGEFTIPSNCYYLRFSTQPTYGNTYNHDICINLSHSGSRNGQYEPYWDFLLNFAIPNVYGKVNGEGNLVQIAANGLKKADYAGTIFDVINLKDCTADIRVSDTPATPGEGLFEPLATPLHYTDLVYRINGVDYPLDGALPYNVDDYGTEEVVAISGEKTVAPVLQLRYGINVGDTTKNLPFNYLSPKMQQTFTEDEKRQARKNIGVDATRADVLALIRANEDALLTALKTAGTITDYTLDAEADANGVYGVTVS
jgi:hypothetical protein